MELRKELGSQGERGGTGTRTYAEDVEHDCAEDAEQLEAGVVRPHEREEDCADREEESIYH